MFFQSYVVNHGLPISHFPEELHDILTTKLNFTVNESQEIRYHTARAGSMSPSPLWGRKQSKKESRKGRMADALAPGGDEGRGKLR